MAAEGAATCVPFRVTLLGPAQSGKTSLVSAFVNNFSPSVYTETNDPVLYYKTMSLSVEKDPRSTRQKSADAEKQDLLDTERFPGSVEIEDTYATERAEGQVLRHEVSDALGNKPDAKQKDAPDAERETFPVLVEIEDTYASDRLDGQDCYGVRRALDNFLGLFATKRDYSKWSSDKSGPPVVFERFLAPKADKYAPVSRIRMAFLIVFDAGDHQSLEEALRVHGKLLEALRKEQKGLKEKVAPVIALVANKADRGSVHMEDIVETTKQHAKVKGTKILLFFVSALEIKKVKVLFRKVLRKVHEQPLLWDMGGTHQRKQSTLTKMATMQQKVFESGQRVLESGKQENCGVQ